MKAAIVVVVVLLLAAVAGAALHAGLKRQQLEAASLAQGLALAGPAKVRVAAYYLDEGRWPVDNADVDLPAEHEFRNDAVSGLAVSAGGVITVTFTGKSGVAGGYIQLTPDAARPHMGIEWRCTTPSYEDIGRWAPQCGYVDAAGSTGVAGAAGGAR